ncbi:MAG: hypothetical protein DRN20_03160 [Thermoplasmata archaeon]|nr:MAG: hypothetical protein DRN20_03160 [Thermoplasmata archaeon]
MRPLYTIGDRGLVVGIADEHDDKKVLRIFEEIHPEIVGVAIAEEDLYYVSSVNKAEGTENKHGSDECEMSGMVSSISGDIAELCSAKGIKIVPLYPNWEEYMNMFCQCVGGLDLIIYSMAARRMHKKAMRKARSEYEYRILMRNFRMRIKGYGKLEKMVCNHIARIIWEKILNFDKRFVIFLDYERVDNVVDILRREYSIHISPIQ